MKLKHTWMVALVLPSASLLFAVASCSSSSTSTPASPSPDSGADVLDAGADASSFPDGAGAKCDPVKQDCADPSLKCTYVKVGSVHRTACEPSNDGPEAQEGQACARTAIGFDNCVKGTHCFPAGGDGLFACRKACATDSQCATGSKCADLTDVPPFFGVCYPTCTPFGAECGGGTCANSFGDNDGTNFFEACRNAGSVGVGGTCSTQWDCQANMECFGMNGFTCHQMCDVTHPCGDAGACSPDRGLPNGAGTCQ